MRHNIFLLSAVVMLTMGVTHTSSATYNGFEAGGGAPAAELAVPVGGGWQFFTWNTTVSTQIIENPFTISLFGPGVLRVTDAFIDGDQFRITVDGSVVGDTSVPTDTGSSQPDPDAAFSDPGWSSGEWPLSVGGHIVEIEIIQAATGFVVGAGFIRVDSAETTETIPTLNGWMLLILFAGVTLLGLVSVRHRQNQ